MELGNKVLFLVLSILNGSSSEFIEKTEKNHNRNGMCVVASLLGDIGG